jgi:hypothetical protein
MHVYRRVNESGRNSCPEGGEVKEMKRTRWISRLLVLLIAVLTMVMAGEALAGDKKGKKDKKDKKDKKGKKEVVVRKDHERTGAETDPTKPKKSVSKKGSNKAGRDTRESRSKRQTRTKTRRQTRQRSQKRTTRRSSGGKK